MDEFLFPPLPEEEFQRLSPEQKLEYLQAAYRTMIRRDVVRAVDWLDMPDRAPSHDQLLQ